MAGKRLRMDDEIMNREHCWPGLLKDYATLTIARRDVHELVPVPVDGRCAHLPATVALSLNNKRLRYVQRYCILSRASIAHDSGVLPYFFSYCIITRQRSYLISNRKASVNTIAQPFLLHGVLRKIKDQTRKKYRLISTQYDVLIICFMVGF